MTMLWDHTLYGNKIEHIKLDEYTKRIHVDWIVDRLTQYLNETLKVEPEKANEQTALAQSCAMLLNATLRASRTCEYLYTNYEFEILAYGIYHTLDYALQCKSQSRKLHEAISSAWVASLDLTDELRNSRHFSHGSEKKEVVK